MLVDKYGRKLTHLRISVTHDCNYGCIFCHREGELGGRDFLKPEHIGLVSYVASQLGIRYFKLTGGEPLFRDDVARIVAEVKREGGGEVSITTNGFFLKERIRDLVDAELDRINVSLHSLKRDVYRLLTRVDGLERVLEGLILAKDYGLPVKLNFVLTGYNYGEIDALLDFASKNGFNVNIIEVIPVGLGNLNFEKIFYSIDGVASHLEKIAVKKIVRDLQSRPVYILPSGIGVELIASYCNPYFCAKCTKIRLTHDGKLKPCINRNDNLVDIRWILEGNMSREEKIDLITKAFYKANELREPYFRLENGICKSFDGKIKCKPRKIE